MPRCPTLKFKELRLRERKEVPQVAQTMHHTARAVKFSTQMGPGPRTQTHQHEGLWNSFGIFKPPPLLETFPGASGRHQAHCPGECDTGSLTALSLLALEDCPAWARCAGTGWLDGQRDEWTIEMTNPVNKRINERIKNLADQ